MDRQIVEATQVEKPAAVVQSSEHASVRALRATRLSRNPPRLPSPASTRPKLLLLALCAWPKTPRNCVLAPLLKKRKKRGAGQIVS